MKEEKKEEEDEEEEREKIDHMKQENFPLKL
jgi:hypothetical protein